MDGLIAKSFQHFICATYGEELWQTVSAAADVPSQGFQAFRRYDSDQGIAVVEAASRALGRPPAEIWEDIGTHLVTHKDLETVRRLLRFGGADFEEFLWSLDDFNGRMQLAVKGINLPELQLCPKTAGHYQVKVSWAALGLRGSAIAGPLVLGVLRALADDYGTLVFLKISSKKSQQGAALIDIDLLEPTFAPARDFLLGGEDRL